MEYVVNVERTGHKEKVERVVLLSQSPRRRELLAFLNPIVASVEIDERSIEEYYMSHYQGEPFLSRVAKTCCEISKAKSDIALEPQTLYVSADTMVVVDTQIYNKPLNVAEAERMLRSYFGRCHHVVTSVCLRMRDYVEVFYTVTEVEFVPYYEELEEAIQSYVHSGTPMDKSGAYGIQSLDPRFVRAIRGDIHTVIGMPVSEVAYRIFRT